MSSILTPSTRMTRRLLIAVLLTIAVGSAGRPLAQGSRFDLLIRNGHVIDGNGNPWIRADVGITGDRIQAVGNLTGATAAKTIDAAGLVVTPGFIDVHSHAG